MFTYFTWLILSIFYFYQFIQRVISSFLLDNILLKFNISLDNIGYFSAFYYLGYVLAHFPLGLLFEYYNPKKIIILCIIVASISILPMIFSDNFYYVIISRFVTGAGSSGAAIGSFYLFLLLFSTRNFSFCFSYMVIFSLSLFTLFVSYFIYIIQLIDINYFLLILLFFGLLLSLICYFCLYDLSVNKKITISIIKHDISSVINNRFIFLISIIGGFMIGPFEGFIDSWINIYIQTIYCIVLCYSSIFSNLLYIGMSLGLLYVGFLLNIFRNKYLLLMFYSYTMFLCFLFLTFKLKYYILSFILFILGFSCSYQMIIIYKINSLINHIHNKTFVISLSNMIMMIFGFFFHNFFSYLMNYYFILNNNFYNFDIFRYLMFFIVLILLFSLISLYYLLLRYIK